MLLKASSEEARAAELALGPRPTQSPRAEREPAPKSALELECDALKRSIAELERKLAAMEQEQAQAIAAAELKARDEAARQHVRDDENRLTELRSALVAARSAFDGQLKGNCAALARTLATTALGRLAELRTQDTDWLARVVSRRISELGANAVVALRIRADDFSGAALDRLRQNLPAGVHIVPDPEIVHKTAKIELRLGEVTIEPEVAVAELIRMLSGDERND